MHVYLCSYDIKSQMPQKFYHMAREKKEKKKKKKVSRTEKVTVHKHIYKASP